MIHISIEELKKVLDATPASQNIMLVGRHGIGKSEILREYFEKKGMKVEAFFLGQMSDPGDLIGLPDKDPKSGKTVFLPPYWFPTDGKPIVLFLDELNRARPEILQTVMDLALNRRLAGKDLPAGSRIISAVNDGEEYQLTDLDPALVSRFNIYGFQPTAEEWLLWAKSAALDDRVIGFISENRALLDGNGEARVQIDSGLEKFPDRRAWKKVSDIIKAMPSIGLMETKILAGVIGAQVAQKFLQYNSANRLVSARDVLLNFEDVKAKLSKYKMHELSVVNESIFRFLETELSKDEESAAAEGLKAYIAMLEKGKKKEAIADFAASFKPEMYKRAVLFISTKAKKEVFDKLLANINVLGK